MVDHHCSGIYWHLPLPVSDKGHLPHDPLIFRMTAAFSSSTKKKPIMWSLWCYHWKKNFTQYEWDIGQLQKNCQLTALIQNLLYLQIASPFSALSLCYHSLLFNLYPMVGTPFYEHLSSYPSSILPIPTSERYSSTNWISMLSELLELSDSWSSHVFFKGWMKQNRIKKKKTIRVVTSSHLPMTGKKLTAYAIQQFFGGLKTGKYIVFFVH